MNKWKIITIIWFMISLWCIDVSVTTLNLGIMTNGFFSITPTQSYHLGVYSAILSFVTIIFLYDYSNKKRKGDE